MTDTEMLEQVLLHIHNRFERCTLQVRGCAISGGELPKSVNIPTGAWYWVEGSLLNDGLHRHPSPDLTDETFDGSVTICAIPAALLNVVDRISEWTADMDEADRDARRAKYQSESFGGYTYTIKQDSRANSASGGLTGWQAAFVTDLNPWRKMA